MLDAIGAESLADAVPLDPGPAPPLAPARAPAGGRRDHALRRVRALAARNERSHPPFVGAGCYPHHVPPVVDQLLLRGEFFTAYTPYQPEVSQGTLQALFEWQTFVCLLTGMDVVERVHVRRRHSHRRGGAHGGARHRPREDRRLRRVAPRVPQGPRDLP